MIISNKIKAVGLYASVQFCHNLSVVLRQLKDINVDVISRGRQGRTREIKLMLPEHIRAKAKDMITEALLL